MNLYSHAKVNCSRHWTAEGMACRKSSAQVNSRHPGRGLTDNKWGWTTATAALHGATAETT